MTRTVAVASITASSVFRFKAKRLHNKQANFVVLSNPDLLTPRERTSAKIRFYVSGM